MSCDEKNVFSVHATVPSHVHKMYLRSWRKKTNIVFESNLEMLQGTRSLWIVLTVPWSI